MPSLTSPPKPKEPRFQRATGPNQLPYGAATQLNQQLAQLGQSPQPEFAVPVPEPKVQGDLTGFDDILFAASDRPEEPITAGAPFGPGPMFLRRGQETDEEFLARVATEIAESPNATTYVKSFAARILNGE